MNRRGRPPAPGVLTPRELEVLELLKQRLSNREISERLGISLQGVKYHVTEIISKLGVGSREEAASWQPDAARRERLAPAFGLLGRLGEALSLSLPPKIVALGLASITVVSLGVIGLAVARSGGGTNQAHGSGLIPTATPDAACPVSRCTRLVPQRFTTLEEAAAQASFVPKLPASIPAGYQPYSVEFTRFASPPIHKEVHNDWITVYYRNSAGQKLIVSQGFPAMLGFVAYPGQGDDLMSRAPADAKGVVSVNGQEARWLKGEPTPPELASPTRAFIPDPDLMKTGGIVLAWEVGRFGDGWEVSPDRSTILTGSPMSYSIASDTLSLADLIAIAQSVHID